VGRYGFRPFLGFFGGASFSVAFGAWLARD
jgi:hypothetical protein